MLVAAVNTLRNLSWAIALLILFRFFGRGGGIFEVVVAAFGSVQIAAAAVRYATTRFRIEPSTPATPETLMVETGLVWRQRRAIPVGRIQNIVITRALAHRLFRLSALKVQTAAGDLEEVELAALSQPDADSLKAELLSRQRAARGMASPAGTTTPGTTPAGTTASSDAAAPPQEPPARRIYHASMRDLILAGATQTRLGAVIGAVLGSAWFVGDLLGFDGDFGFVRPFTGYLEILIPTGAEYVAAISIGFVVILGAIAAGWAASIATSIYRYHGFRIELTHDGKLNRRFGLVTVQDNAFPIHRLQKLVIRAPLIQRKLGFVSCRASTAGSFMDDDAGGSTILCPIIPLTGLGALLELVCPGLYLDRLSWRQVSPLAVSRWTVRNGVLLLLPAAASAWLIGWWALIPAAAALVLAYVLARLQYARTFYSVGPDYIALRSGLLTVTTLVMPRQRVQVSVLAQQPTQRLRDLATLRLSSAVDPFFPDIEIPHIPRDLGQRIQDQLLQPARPAT